MSLSIRQITHQYGLNSSHVRELTRRGVLSVQDGCSPRRPKYAPEQIEGLAEGRHYTACRACGQWAGQITTKHLQVCSGMTVGAYKARWPDAHLLSEVVAENKVKTKEQRQRQSDTLVARFKTPEGEVTRRQISEASSRLMGTPYREQAASHLRKVNSERTGEISRETKARWESGALREAVEGWHRENREASLAGAAYARTHLTDTTMAAARAAMCKTSKMHLGFKARMVGAGLTGFVTEGQVGPFAVDEAHFGSCLAVEVDGCYWHGCEECGQPGVSLTLANDKSKNAYLAASGWTVLRLPGHMVRKNPKEALGLIQAAVEQLHRGAS